MSGVNRCPFCGGDRVSLSRVERTPRVVCASCNAQGPHEPELTGSRSIEILSDAAIASWNYRPSEAVVLRVKEKMDKFVKLDKDFTINCSFDHMIRKTDSGEIVTAAHVESAMNDLSEELAKFLNL